MASLNLTAAFDVVNNKNNSQRGQSMLFIIKCSVFFFKDAMASVKMDNKSFFNKKNTLSS